MSVAPVGPIVNGAVGAPLRTPTYPVAELTTNVLGPAIIEFANVATSLATNVVEVIGPAANAVPFVDHFVCDSFQTK